jgi:hypothetical protein
MPLLEQEILKRPEHLSSPPVFCRFPVAPSLVFRIVFFEAGNMDSPEVVLEHMASWSSMAGDSVGNFDEENVVTRR